MKKVTYLLIIMLVFAFVSCNNDKSNETKENNQENTNQENKSGNASYSIGMQITESLIDAGLADYLNIDKLFNGLDDQLANKSEIDVSKTDEKIQSFFIEMQTSEDVSHLVDDASYSIGVQLAENFKVQGLDSELDFESLKEGIKDHFGNKATISIDEANQNVEKFYTEFQESKSGEKIAEGEEFLAENGKRPEVTTTESGLQYEVLTEGNGPKPTLNSTVKTHYHGTLLDGTVFDSSVDRGEPISFPVSGVIAGWTEALQMMPVGSKWKLYIPYDLAYGERGSMSIGPYETLIFEVELIAIEK